MADRTHKAHRKMWSRKFALIKFINYSECQRKRWQNKRTLHADREDVQKTEKEILLKIDLIFMAWTIQAMFRLLENA